MNAEHPARDPIGNDARIDALDERLKAAREREEQRTKPVVRRAPKPDGTPVAKAAPAALDETEDGAATDAPKKRRRRRRKPGGAEGSASAGQD